MEKKTLKQLIDEKINVNSFELAHEDTHSIVNIIVVATLQERAYDFFHIMMNEERKNYSCDLFEMIETTPWYDFNLQENGKYVVVWKLESVGDSEELSEYFSECLNEYTQAFGDIVVEIVSKESIDEGLKVFTHDESVQIKAFKNE